MVFRSYFLFVLIFLGVCLQTFAIEIPKLTSPVMDEVGLLNANTKNQLEQSLFAFQKNNGVQLQVYIIKSLGGDDIASVAIQVFDQWKLGDEKTDKGLLFLIAPNEKRLRIEVGQGLEGDIPDAIAKRIISDVVRPYFQKGQFAIGIIQGVSTVQNYILNSDPEQKQQLSEESEAANGNTNMWVILAIVGIWILIFIFNPSLAIYILFSAMRGGGGGHSGGGSWSGGGGRSSGGGASGSW